MQTFPQILQDALDAGQPERFLLVFSGDGGAVEFSNERIDVDTGVRLTEMFNSEEDLTIGLCPSAELSLTLLNDDRQLNSFTFGTCTAYLGARTEDTVPGGVTTRTYDDGTYVFVPVGVFIVERPDYVNQDTVDVTAYDQMSLFDVDMPTAADLNLTVDGTHPLTAAALLAAMCSYVGVTFGQQTFLNQGLSITKWPDDWETATMREVLGQIAEVAGSNARFDRDGQLVFSYFTDASATVFDEGDYDEFSQVWYNVSGITSLHVRHSDANSEVIRIPAGGTDDNPYLIQDNEFLKPGASSIDTAADNILTQLRGAPTFKPSSASVFSDWSIQPGDKITMRSGQTDYDLPVYKVDYEWHGSVTGNLSNSGNEAREPLPEFRRRNYGTSRRINRKVEKGEVTAQLVIEGQLVHVQDGDLLVDGTVLAQSMVGKDFTVKNLNAAGVYASADIQCGGAGIVQSIGDGTASGGTITCPYTLTGGGSGSFSFNIADTAFYIAGVQVQPINTGWTAVGSANIGISNTLLISASSAGGGFADTSKTLTLTQDGNTVYLRDGDSTGTQVAKIPVSGGSHSISIERGSMTASAPSPIDAVQIWTSGVTTNQRFYSFKVTCGTAEKWYYFYVNV